MTGLASRVESDRSEQFVVFLRNGHILRKGDLWTVTRPNGEKTTYKFISCTHSRKVYVEVISNETFETVWKQEYYANVLEVGIWDNIYDQWTFPLS